MKRVASGGDSPLCKQLLSFCPSSQGTENSLSQTQSIDSDITDKLLALKPSQSQEETIELPLFQLNKSDDEIGPSLSDSIEKDSSEASIECKLLGLPSAASYISRAVSAEGISETATAILENTDLKNKILELLLIEAHQEFKCSLRKSILKKTQERTYLLTLTPQVLCEEFANNAPMCFQLLVKGILGKNIDTVFRSQKLKNIVALLYSTGSKYVNRKAIGFALQLTTAARDGGLREDSLNILSCFVHPRTSQVYDKEILANGWDTYLQSLLQEEKEHFEKIRSAENLLEKIHEDDYGSDDLKQNAQDKLDQLLDETPPQFQLVWDNMNIATKHRLGLDWILK